MTDPEKLFEELKAARAEIATSRGALLEDEFSAVWRSYRLFRGNLREFERYLAHYDEDVTARHELWALKNRKLFDAHLDEVDRLLHNYLTAAATLRDHTRRLWQQHPPDDLALTDEYEDRIRETFAESPLARFVQDLRNDATHRRLPAVQGGFTWRAGGGEESTVALSKAILLRWDGWTPAAREFIESAVDPIDLRIVVRDYANSVDGFADWFSRAFVLGHRPEFEELNAHKERYNERLRQSGLALPEDAR